MQRGALKATVDGVPRDVPIDAIGGGQVVTYDASTNTFVGGSGSVVSTLDFPRAQPHADDIGFEGTPGAFPSGAVLYNPSSGTDLLASGSAVATANAPTAGVDFTSFVAASGNDGSRNGFDCNSARPSWFLWQPPAEAARRFGIFWPLSALPTDGAFVFKFGGLLAQYSSSVNGDGINFVIAGDASGVPAIGGSPARFASIGVRRRGGGGDMSFSKIVANGGGPTEQVSPFSAGRHPVAWPTHLILHKRGNEWYQHAGIPPGMMSKHLNHGGTADLGAGPHYWGIVFEGTASTSSIWAIDYMHRYDGAQMFF